MKMLSISFSLLLLTAAGVGGRAVRGQEPPSTGTAYAGHHIQHITPELVLARATVKEESLFPGAHSSLAEHDIQARDGCAMIDAVYARGAARSHIDYEAFARRYSQHVFTPDESRPWIADLRGGTHIPNDWPRGLFWEPQPRSRRYSGMVEWMKIFHIAAEVRQGRGDALIPLDHRCPAPPDHWGGKMDHWRGVANGWVQEQCGASQNEAWLISGLHTPAELARARASVATIVPASIASGQHHRR